MLAGDLPSPLNPPSGCTFRTRCPKAKPRCAEEVPPLYDVGRDHGASCHYWDEPTPAATEEPGGGTRDVVDRRRDISAPLPLLARSPGRGARPGGHDRGILAEHQPDEVVPRRREP